jgi:hypothetical protein
MFYLDETSAGTVRRSKDKQTIYLIKSGKATATSSSSPIQTVLAASEGRPRGGQHVTDRDEKTDHVHDHVHVNVDVDVVVHVLVDRGCGC